MSPSNPHTINQLRHLVYYHLDNDLLKNAVFLASRLHAYDVRSAESSSLLARCQFRLGQLQLAYESSRIQGARGLHLGCAYVFAQSCLSLHRYKEGIGALERSRGLWGGRSNWNKHSETSRRHLPDAAAVYCLLGKLWHGYGDPKKAVDYYVEALKINPFMWDAFLGLCDTGANIRIPNIFKMTPEMLAILSSTSNSEAHSDPFTVTEDAAASNAPQSDPFFGFPSRSEHASLGTGSAALFQKLNESTASNPTSAAAMTASASLGFDTMETPTGPSSGGGGGGGDGTFALGGSVGGAIAMAAAVEAPHAPSRKHRNFPGMDFSIGGPGRLRNASSKPRSAARAESDEVSESLRVSTLAAAGERKRTISGQVAQPSSSQANDPSAAPQRRSERLFNQIRPTSSKFSSSTGSVGMREGRELKKAKATGTKGRPGGTSAMVGRVVSGNRKAAENADVDSKENQSAVPNGHLPGAIPRSSPTELSKKQEALQWVLDLFAKLGAGYFALTHFQCPDALQIFNSITPAQRETTWVLAQIGRALYEQGSYPEAEKYFRKIRLLSPSRLEDMEIYSTVLWHLKNEVELAYLAHELVDIDRLSPQAWCAIGNTFSLQRDHDQALKCFKRATQLDPSFAYAFTHQGHEHVTNEEYDKALAAYRCGISADSRYYVAWYGLGKVYEKMGKYDVAEKHYRTAMGINPTNALLICCVGMVLEKLKNPRAALVQYAEACNLAPKSTMSRFKKARVLMALQEPHLALAELRVLKDTAPDDANVHFLLGKLYKMLRQRANAIKHFTIALNLDPKAGQFIKDAIESLEEDDEGDEAVMA
ncbi:MAG: anaphase-promoting complex subunit cdc27 [Thelocarpon impressellum]|nr:MAG: anaphase-promoting complex subunit cdc27 [Thelocarpon impressellum]